MLSLGLIDQFTLFLLIFHYQQGLCFPIISFPIIIFPHIFFCFHPCDFVFLSFYVLSLYLSLCFSIFQDVISSFSCFHNSVFFFFYLSAAIVFILLYRLIFVLVLLLIYFFPSSSSFVFHPFSIFISVLLILLILNFILFLSLCFIFYKRITPGCTIRIKDLKFLSTRPLK